MLSKKLGFLVLILTVILLSMPLETRAAGADCGPKAFQEFVEHACDTIPLEWTWNPLMRRSTPRLVLAGRSSMPRLKGDSLEQSSKNTIITRTNITGSTRSSGGVARL